MSIFEGAKHLIDSIVNVLTTIINAIKSCIEFVTGLMNTALDGVPAFFVAMFTIVLVILIIRVVKS